MALKKEEQKLALASGEANFQDYQRTGSGTKMHGHDYARISQPNSPGHIEYANDVNFFLLWIPANPLKS